MTSEVSLTGAVFVDDKRLLSSSRIGEVDIAVERESERDWHYCKYCYEDAPTFILTETVTQNGKAFEVSKLRCCWQCGSGLEFIESGVDALSRQDGFKEVAA